MIFSSKKFPVGIDISDLSIKLVSLYQRGTGIYLEALGRVELPIGTVMGGEIKKTEVFVSKLKELVGNPLYGNISSTEVNACLPETKTFIKLIDVGRNPNDIKDIVLAELENNIPMATSDIYWDWQLVDIKDDHKYILVGAAPRVIADQYIELFKQAGLTIVGLELESISTVRALLREEDPTYAGDKQTTYAVIDVGARRTSMVIYGGNTILFSVSLPISSEEATKKIAETMNIDEAQAEKAKLVCGFSQDKADGVVRQILMSMVDRLVLKINDIIKFQASHYPQFPSINKILLAGSGVNIEKFDEILAEKLGLAVVKGNVRTNLNDEAEKFDKIFTDAQAMMLKEKNIESTTQIEQDISVNFATAVGLALRPIFSKMKRK